jgi:crotonobetainyl-CoA:carnitine CoA-transferase CaiB-like acyl-CoA transferase
LDIATWERVLDDAPGPLAGVRVLDLTAVVMGPSATQMLGDLGADVIKIEPPGGDSMRWVGPSHHPSMGPLYLQANRNKRSVVMDLKSAEGRAALLELAADADVFISNVRPAAMDRLGLGYEAVCAVNPAIIYCAAVGYGDGGPASGRAVYDDLMQAASGISGLFGEIDGTPRYAPVNICDRIVGLHVVVAIQAALIHRTRTGVGQSVEVPMFETMAQFVLADHSGGRAFDPPLGKVGYKRLISATRNPFRTRDGFLAVAVYNDKHWREFGKIIGIENLVAPGSIFADMATRTVHSTEIGEFLAERFVTRTSAEWLEVLDRADIPCGPVNTINDLYSDPHLEAVGLFQTVDHPTEGKIVTTRNPIKFSQSPTKLRRMPPNLGEHGRVEANVETPNGHKATAA